jgi:hypothetical protein
MSAPARRAPQRGSAGRTALAIGLAALLTFLASGGGRIVGSDEITMLEVSLALMRGRVAVPEGATLQGPDGRHYSKNAAGQAVLALPLVAAGRTVATIAPVAPARKPMVTRAVASTLNAIVTAALLTAFYLAARALDTGARPAFAATVLLGFTTPVWPYAKSFMAEPLQSLGLLLALAGAARARAGEAGRERLAALGAFVAVSAKLSMLPLALACLVPLAPWRGRGSGRGLAIGLAGVAAALAGHALYNLARFGTPFESGYGAQATAAAYTTPLLVGLYGLLLSSGKGLAWFAPALWLAPRGVRRALARGRERGAPQRAVLAGAALAWAGGLLLYARFQHWAGDGSFGPRYLVPLLPLAFLAVGFALDGLSRAGRRLAWGLAIAGLIVQLGGVAIYFGAQMREAGDYPYTRPLDDPRFMESSHFNPRYSPIAGHWGMLLRNAGEHLRGEWPRLSGGAEERAARTGLPREDEARLLHGLDFWWGYALYAGLPAWPVLAAALALAVAAAWAWARALAALRDERGSG